MSDAIPLCPQCGKRLERVRMSDNCMLNQYQFDAVKAGDWYCKACPGNDRGTKPLCYWWDREVWPKVPQ